MKDTSSVGDSAVISLQGREDVDQLAIEIAQLVHAKLNTLEKFTNRTYPAANGDVMRRAVRAASALRLRDDYSLYTAASQRRLTVEAQAVMEVLFGDTDPPHEFWNTRLGVDIVWAIGYPKPVVPLAAAQAVLACSRGRIWDLLNRRRIELTSDSLRDYARCSPRWIQRSADMWFR